MKARHLSTRAVPSHLKTAPGFALIRPPCCGPGRSSVYWPLAAMVLQLLALFAQATNVQRTYFKASNTEAGDLFGHAIAFDGNTLVVGAPGESSGSPGINGNQSDNGATRAGAVYVFVRNGGVWSQQAYLKASNPGAEDEFGKSVAIAGDTIVVGAIGEGSNATGVNGN
ncbi:MAG TPA: hypothetical protein DCY13_22605, partial [Verrucomicrobiales bacterium]|nr:hypothetical protein [Verrucomicrobiales bacterium]